MLSFKKLTLEDIPIILPFFEEQNSRMCDYTIGSAFMWRDFFHTEFAIQNQTLYFKVDYINNQTAFSLPIGTDSRDFQHITAYCHHNGIPIIFCNVLNEHLPLLQAAFPQIQYKSDRDWHDYLYYADDIANLVGRKYSGQRNHINKFRRQYPEHSFVEITHQNIEQVREFYIRLAKTRDLDDDMAKEEDAKVIEVFDQYENYGMFGGFVKAGESIVGMSIGEIINDTLFVHIEKADTTFPGAYQILVNSFANQFVTEHVKYINREEDMGNEGLRTSKLSYHPIELIEKNTVKVL